MWAYRLLSTAMDQIGKPISRLEDIARYLHDDNAPQARVREPYADPTPKSADDAPRQVYAGAPIAVEDDQLVFDATPRLTTKMDFAPDDLGYLINSEGLVLMGQSDDGLDHAQRLRLSPIRLDDGAVMAARATSTIRYKANLPKTPVTRGNDAAAEGADTEALAAHALAAGDINIFDARGRAIMLQLRWACIGLDHWRLLVRIAGPALVVRAAGRGWWAAADVTFDARGRVADAEPVTLDLGRGIDPVTLDFGRCGLTQFEDAAGLVKVLACSQNGWPQARLREAAVREDGRVLGCFDNGRVGLLGLAAFADDASHEDTRRAA